MEFVNARWSEEGFSEEGLLADWTAYVHPDDLAEFVKVRTRSLATGEPYEAEVRFRRIDGEYRWCLIRVVSLRDETGKPVKRYSTATNIEDRKRAENALRRSEALLAETQGLSRTGSLLLDASTREVIWSAECARIFGYDPSVKPTISLALQRVHPDDVGLAQWAIDSALEGGIDTAYSEYRLVMPDGSVKYVHSAIRSDADASGSRLALGAVTDVTAAKLAEVALHEAQTELTHVTRMTTLGELTASIAHEVNQPLAAIVTNGEVCLRLLDQKPVDLAEVREAIGDTISNGRRASEIIRRVRALSRKTETQKVALDVNDVINEVIPLLQREVLTPSGVASPGPRPGAAGRVRRSHPAAAGDHQSGRQRHGGDGRRDRPAARADGSIRAGHGPGARCGSGLGRGHRSGQHEAALQRLLHDQAQRHGHGAVDLPLDHREPWRHVVGLAQCRTWRDVSVHTAAASRGDVMTPGRPIQDGSAAGAEPIVIIVEDDQPFRDALRRLFRTVGLQTEVFASAAELLQSKLPDVPGCLILDVRLPGLSGLDLQSELARASIRTPIVFMTGHGDIPMSVRAMKAGAVDFLTKPFRDQDMLDAVAAAIERDRRRREQERTASDLKAHFDSADATRAGGDGAGHRRVDEQAGGSGGRAQ